MGSTSWEGKPKNSTLEVRFSNILRFLDLRRQARHLENEIDAKLVAFSKLGISKTSSHVSSDSLPLLDEEHVFENMASEVDCLLTKVIRKVCRFIE